MDRSLLSWSHCLTNPSPYLTHTYRKSLSVLHKSGSSWHLLLEPWTWSSAYLTVWSCPNSSQCAVCPQGVSQMGLLRTRNTQVQEQRAALHHPVTQVLYSAPAPGWFTYGFPSHQSHAPRCWDTDRITSALLERPFASKHSCTTVLPAITVCSLPLFCSTKVKLQILPELGCFCVYHCRSPSSPMEMTLQLTCESCVAPAPTSRNAISWVWHLLPGSAIDLRAGHGESMFASCCANDVR